MEKNNSFGPDSSWDPNMSCLQVKYSGDPSILELPLHAGLRFGLTNQLSLNVAVGPYFGIGLGGTYKSQRIYIDNNNTATIQKDRYDIYSKDGNKRFEVGVDSYVGLEFMNHYTLSLSYQYQLNETAPISSPVDNAQAFSLNIGYRF